MRRSNPKIRQIQLETFKLRSFYGQYLVRRAVLHAVQGQLYEKQV